MTVLTQLFFWGYVAMLLGVGTSGIFIARWELTRVFHVPLATYPDGVRATLLNQYRFLKALELGFGAYAALFHREIFAVPSFHSLFLFVLFAAVAARALSMLVDGRPSAVFVAFTVLELITGVLVLATPLRPAAEATALIHG
jgi:hypothetical protein